MRTLLALSLLVFFLAAVTRPRAARCPSGMWLDEGVRPSGEYQCAPLPAARWTRSQRGGWADTSEDPTWSVEGRVYCTGGSHAITVDGRTVGCQR